MIFDSTVIAKILEGIPILGGSVLVLTELVKVVLKKVFKTGNVAGILSSVVASAGSTLFYLTTNHMFTLPLFLGYSALVCLAANKVFQAFHTSSEK